MGNSIDVTSPLDGSINDIFRLIFKPDDKNTYTSIRNHVTIYPKSLTLVKQCFGMSPHCMCSIEGSPLHLAATFSKKSSLEVISLLIELGAEVNNSNGVGCSHIDYYRYPLHMAIRNYHNNSSIETIKLLLDKGANINLIDYADTPIMVACRKFNNILKIKRYKYSG